MKFNVQRPPGRLLSRRDFLRLAGVSAVAGLAGCATNPVTGKSQFMLVSEESEISLDRAYAPHQISGDFGAVRDSALNDYLTTVGERLAARSHRPNMPYSFRAVNALHVNAYAFPGGTIAATRGILLNLQNEAELAALLGHEIGHVAARHAAASMSRGLALNTALTLGAAALQEYAADYSDLAAGLGAVSAGALLAHYSRDNEREADALALEYMTRADLNPSGCLGLMDMLRRLQKEQPNAIELMFATHPMSAERYQNTADAIREKYQSARDYPVNREAYLDHTARLRARREALEKFQQAAQEMGARKTDAAAAACEAGLKLAPDDYVGLLLLANCRLTQNQWAAAEQLAGEAAQVYPAEPMSVFVSGLARLAGRRYEAAGAAFDRYEQLLPGNPNTMFYQGRAREGLGQRPAAADCYLRFLRQAADSENARYARRRLKEWGYLR